MYYWYLCTEIIKILIGLGCPRSGKGYHSDDSFLFGNTFIPYSLSPS